MPVTELTEQQRAALPDATVYAAASEREGAAPADRTFGRWHVLPDSTVIYERRLGELEVAQVLTAATLASSPGWVEVPE